MRRRITTLSSPFRRTPTPPLKNTGDCDGFHSMPEVETAVSKVGIEWKPAQSQVFFNGGVGVRLTGDDSVVMRLRKGTLGLYVKRSF